MPSTEAPAADIPSDDTTTENSTEDASVAAGENSAEDSSENKEEGTVITAEDLSNISENINSEIMPASTGDAAYGLSLLSDESANTNDAGVRVLKPDEGNGEFAMFTISASSVTVNGEKIAIHIETKNTGYNALLSGNEGRY